MLELYVNIKKHRQRLGLTQSELAQRVGYTDRSTIAKIEKGVIDLPQSKIEQFASIFGISAGELMGWDKITDEQAGQNDLIAAVVVRMRTDADFFQSVEMLHKMDAAKVAGFKAMLDALTK